MSEGQTQRIRRLREDLFLVTDDTVLDIIEAVLDGANVNDGWWYGTECWSVIKPTEKSKPSLPTFADMLGIYADKPCLTCGGSKEEPIGCYEPMMSGEPTWNACNDDFHDTCPTCGGSGMMSSEWDSEVPVPCPDCGGNHFVPGKGKGM